MKLLTVRAAAERLGVGYSTLKQWIYQGSVRTTHTAGGHHRIAESEIERLIAQPSESKGSIGSKGARGGHRSQGSQGSQGAAGSTGSRGARGSKTRAAQPATTGLIVALSGRNRLRGFVEEVRTDGLLGQIRLRIGGEMLTAVITGDAIQELKLRRGDDAVAIIKSTDVMIARESTDAAPPRRRAR